jgi:hypothetical protein
LLLLPLLPLLLPAGVYKHSTVQDHGALHDI